MNINQMETLNVADIDFSLAVKLLIQAHEREIAQLQSPVRQNAPITENAAIDHEGINALPQPRSNTPMAISLVSQPRSNIPMAISLACPSLAPLCGLKKDPSDAIQAGQLHDDACVDVECAQSLLVSAASEKGDVARLDDLTTAFQLELGSLEEQPNALANSIDSDGNGHVCVTSTSQEVELAPSSGGVVRTTLVKIFSELDTDKGGTLSTAELRAALQAVGVPAARAQKLLNLADADGSGEIDIVEWRKAVESGEDEEMKDVSKKLLQLRSHGSVEEGTSHNCMLCPDSRTRLAWDTNLAVLCLYVALVIPFTDAFEEWIPGDLRSGFIRQFELAIDVVFLVDVCLNFRTGFVNKDGIIILDARQVARAYVSSWFIPDVVSSIPIAELTNGRISSVRFLKLLKIPKLLRALRVIKSVIMANSELFAFVEEYFSSPFLRAVCRRAKMFISTFLLCHWMACLMALFSTTWLSVYIAKQGSEAALWPIYLAAIYWAATTMTTLGWGDIHPTTDIERVYTCIAMVVGAAYYGYAVGTIASIVSSQELNDSAYHDRMDEIYAWLDHHKVPAALRRRIIRYFKSYLRDQAAVSHGEIVDALSPTLRNEIAQFVIHEDIRNNPLFDNLPINAIARLQKIVKKTNVDKEQTFVQAGESGTAMFILSQGKMRLESLNANGEKMPPRNLYGGDSFGEEILTGLEERYTYTVVAVSRASLYMIEESEFQRLFEHMPDIKALVAKNANELYSAWDQKRH